MNAETVSLDSITAKSTEEVMKSRIVAIDTVQGLLTLLRPDGNLRYVQLRVRYPRAFHLGCTLREGLTIQAMFIQGLPVWKTGDVNGYDVPDLHYHSVADVLGPEVVK